MSLDRAKSHLAQFGLEDRIQLFDVSSATVELAAQAVGCQPAHIAKTLSFLLPEGPVLILAAGDARIDNSKYKARFHTKAKMLTPQQVLELLDRCGDQVLMEHPTALLVLMRRMFTWGQIPRMRQLKELLLESVRRHPELTDRQRGNLLGECDLIESFLYYNDIGAMSRFHRSASRQMTRQAVSIQSHGSWTFGSPSVLMMFHRTPGQLDRELADMDECMPHYYQITGGHGMGAQRIMEGEAALARGRLNDGAIALERARAAISGSGQENMALCCDFLEMRLHMAAGEAVGVDLRRRRQLLQQHNAMWLHIFDSTAAYCQAVLGRADDIPELFREHRLDTVNFLGPCLPMMQMIENQVYLAQGAYARVIGGSEGLLALCRGMHYALVELYVLVQTAAAYEKLGKRREAAELLGQAAALARPDALCGKWTLSAGAAAGVRGPGPGGGGAEPSAGERQPGGPAAGSAAGGLGPPDRAGMGRGPADGPAAQQPGDRGAAVFDRGHREAVHQPDLFQAAPDRRRPHQAPPPGGADGGVGISGADRLVRPFGPPQSAAPTVLPKGEPSS